MIIQLHDPIHMETPKGRGYAHFLCDYGPNADGLWIVFMEDSGEVWWVPNDKVRVSGNWSLGQKSEKTR